MWEKRARGMRGNGARECSTSLISPKNSTLERKEDGGMRGKGTPPGNYRRGASVGADGATFGRLKRIIRTFPRSTTSAEPSGANATPHGRLTEAASLPVPPHEINPAPLSSVSSRVLRAGTLTSTRPPCVAMNGSS